MLPLAGMGSAVTVVFPPGAITQAIAGSATPAQELLGLRLDLRPVWGPVAEALIARVAASPDHDHALAAMEAALSAAIGELRLDPADSQMAAKVRQAYARIANACGRVGAAAVAAELGITPRALQKAFARHSLHGFAELCAIHRFWDALATWLNDQEQPWSDVAHACGFVDMAQLSHLFDKILGIRPSRLRDLCRRGAFFNSGILVLPGAGDRWQIPLAGATGALAKEILSEW